MKKGRVLAVVIGILAVFLLLTACSKGNQQGGNLPHVKWFVFTSSANSENTEAFDHAAEIAKEKLGVELELIGLNSGSYASKMQTLSAANEKFDIMYVSNWMNNYYQNVSKGALLPLDDLLKENGENLYKAVPDYWWEAAKIDGKIYAVPNQQIAARAPCYSIPTQNVKSMGLDLSDVNTNLIDDYKTVYDRLDEYFKKVKEKTGRYTFVEGDMWSEHAYMYGLEELIGSNMPGVIYINENSDKITVFNQYESEEFKFCIEKNREWVKQGLKQPYPIQPSEKRLDDFIGEGKVMPWIVASPSYTCNIERVLRQTEKIDFSLFMRTKALLATGGLTATMNGISKTSENPEMALKVLELANTDSEFFNAVAFGKEGVQYERLGENRIKKITDPAYNVYTWAVGNVFNGFIEEDDEEDIWEQTKKINDEAMKSPALGFAPNTDNLKTQIAGCQSAVEEYMGRLTMGFGDDSDYDAFIKKLKAAGVDDIIEELQRQINEWQNTK